MEQNTAPNVSQDTTKPKRTPASPELLAQAFRYLAGALILNIALNLLTLWAQSASTISQLIFVLQIATFITAILALVALYIAARRLGFGKGVTIVAIILALFIPLLNLVLVISAIIRITQHLRASGWKMTWSGPKPPNAPV